MGLFSKKTDAVPAQQMPPQQYNNAPHGHHNTRHSNDVPPSGRRSGGFLSRRRSSSLSSSDLDNRHHNNNGGGGGLLHRNNRNSQSMNNGNRTTGGGGGLFSRNRDVEDPSISQARERVQMAEQAEADAQRALVHAKESVQDARQHVRNLEIEAEEDARRAKVKQHAAKDIGKHSSKLGRKF